jgi:hypothetical protein
MLNLIAQLRTLVQKAEGDLYYQRMTLDLAYPDLNQGTLMRISCLVEEHLQSLQLLEEKIFKWKELLKELEGSEEYRKVWESEYGYEPQGSD